MWICDNCQESNEDNFDTCWKCQTLSEDNFKKIQSNNSEKKTIDDEDTISSFNDLVIFCKKSIISFVIFCKKSIISFLEFFKTYYKIIILLLCIFLIIDTVIGYILCYIIISFYCLFILLIIILHLIEGHFESITTSIRNNILKFTATNFMTRLPDRQLKIFLKFLKTGEITKKEAKPIYRNMLLGVSGLTMPVSVVAFFVTDFHWLWLPIMWWVGGAILDRPTRTLLTKAGLKDTGEKFGLHKDIETIKNYFKK
jgi:hypothetical protein